MELKIGQKVVTLSPPDPFQAPEYVSSMYKFLERVGTIVELDSNYVDESLVYFVDFGEDGYWYRAEWLREATPDDIRIDKLIRNVKGCS